jgi:histidinol-phosphate aminotransferase
MFFRQAVDQMESYTPGEQPQGTGYVKLNTNENPYPPSPLVAEAIAAETAKLVLYPESSNRVVREAAAKIYGVDPEQVIATNGSDEMLRVLCQACAGEGEVIAAFYPSYTLYKTLAEIQDAKFRLIEFTPDYRIPQDADFSDVKLVFLPNPNAPSGTLLNLEELSRVCEAAPESLVVVDEAYADFADFTALPLLEKYANVIVTRTLSKSYSLAGLRVGLGFSSREIIAGLWKVRDSYNLDRLSQAGAAAALLDQEHMRRNVAKILQTRERLVAELRKLGAEVCPSSANFVLAKLPQAKAIYQQLKERKILVRYFDLPRLSDCVRITVGTDEQVGKLLAALAEII